jgi:hypothetical protein
MPYRSTILHRFRFILSSPVFASRRFKAARDGIKQRSLHGGHFMLVQRDDSRKVI